MLLNLYRFKRSISEACFYLGKKAVISLTFRFLHSGSYIQVGIPENLVFFITSVLKPVVWFEKGQKLILRSTSSCIYKNLTTKGIPHYSKFLRNG